MAKLYFLVITAVILSMFKPSELRAQAFTNESTAISAGYGFVTFSNTISNWINQFAQVDHSELGPIYLKVERGVTDHIGLGLNFAYVKDAWGYDIDGYDSLGHPITYTETDTRTAYSILGRINFHIGDSKKVDPYVGFGMGYRNASWKSSTNNPGQTGLDLLDLQTFVPFGFEFSVGVRYLFSPNFEAYTEWGAAKSVFQLGIVFYMPGVAATPVQLIHP